LKESLDNEKELWKNKAINLKRNSATKKPELLSNFKNYSSNERKTHYIPTTRHSTFPAHLERNNIENKNDIVTHMNNNNNKAEIDINDSRLNYIGKHNSTKNDEHRNPSGSKSNNRSTNSEDNESDYEDRNLRLNTNKINNRKVVVSDINSDVEGLSQK
jgi:hypothetical protein